MKQTSMLAVALLCGLTSCSNLKQAWDTVTTAEVPAKTIIVAANAFDAIQPVATTYIRYCTPVPAPAGCDDTVIKTKLIPAIRSGRDARNSLEQFVADHPGALGPKGLYDTLTTATATIQTIIAEYKD